MRRARETQVEKPRVSARLKPTLRKVSELHTCNREVIMKSNQLESRIGGAVLALSLLLGIGIVVSTTAQAQNPDDRYAQDRDRNDQNQRGRNWDHYGNYGG